MKKLVITFIFASLFSLPPVFVMGGQPSSKKRSTICISLTNILNTEISGTKDRTKLGILRGGLKYVTGTCGKGSTPDLTKALKGVSKKGKVKI